MYQALYRKYRPKTLEDICGQDAIVKIIKNSILNNKISHAYLFAGPRGTGKTSLAKVFSKIINCENPIDCKPCGLCVKCTQSNNSDIIEIDAASNNGVDEIRELRSKVNLVPAYGKYKVYIIDEVHMLTTGAFNALLKTLEEPPAHIIFILATTDPHKIPETIISRCQRLDFKKIALSDIVDRLKKIAQAENIEITDAALMEIAILADGGMRDSLGMLDEAAAYTDGKITETAIHDINGTLTANDLKELIILLVNNDLENVFKTLDKYNDRGKNFVKLTEELILYMRNLLVYKKAPNYFSTLNYNLDNYKDITFSTSTLIKYIELLNKCLIEMKNTNNPKLMLELTIIKMLSLANNNDLTRETLNSQHNMQSNIVPNTRALSESEKIAPAPQHSINTVEKTEPIIQQKKKTVENSVEKPTPNRPLPQRKPQINQEISIKINELKQLRIDNTLAHFNKKNMQPLKALLDKLNDYLLDTDYSKSASMILDGLLKAASDENIIFMYKTPSLAKVFNENLIAIEKIIEVVCGKHYKVIAVNQEEWEEIKREFNGKTRPFIYKEETIKLEDIFQNKKNEINELFGDIIEYK